MPAFRASVFRFLVPALAVLPLLDRGPQAGLYFADSKVLPGNRAVDIKVWLPHGTALPRPETLPSDSLPAYGDSPAADPWSCAPGNHPFRPASCQVSTYRRDGLALHEYLYRSFLNLEERTRKGDLAAEAADHRSALDALVRPVIALKVRKDSCLYLIVHNQSYAPAASGRVSCRDLSQALAAIDGDLAGRGVLDEGMQRKPSEKVVLSPGRYVFHAPQVLDLGFTLTGTVPLPIPTDTEESAGPYSQTVERFDLGDLTDVAFLPLALRPYILYRNVVGFRATVEYASFALDEDILSALRSDAAANGVRLDDWRIVRMGYGGELLLGGTYATAGAETFMAAHFGIFHLVHSEKATLDGKEREVPGLLDDVTAVHLGGSVNFRFRGWCQLGFEMGLLLKDFRLRHATTQPDGTGNEFQIRMNLGGFKRIHLAIKDGIPFSD